MSEAWEDGTQFLELRQQREAIKAEREALENERKAIAPRRRKGGGTAVLWHSGCHCWLTARVCGRAQQRRR